MCPAPEPIKERVRSFERLDQLRERLGTPLNGKGAAARRMRDAGIQADVHQPLQSRMLLPSLAVLAFCLLLNQVGLFVPVVMVVRNCVLPKTPRAMRPAYPACTDEMLSSEMTIVVSVKDACSQAPGFIRGLEVFAPPEMHLIYTFPNFESCAKVSAFAAFWGLSIWRAHAACTRRALAKSAAQKPPRVRAALLSSSPPTPPSLPDRPPIRLETMEEGDAPPTAAAREPHARVGRRDPLCEDEIRDAAA